MFLWIIVYNKYLHSLYILLPVTCNWFIFPYLKYAKTRFNCIIIVMIYNLTFFLTQYNVPGNTACSFKKGNRNEITPFYKYPVMNMWKSHSGQYKQSLLDKSLLIGMVGLSACWMATPCCRHDLHLTCYIKDMQGADNLI